MTVAASSPGAGASGAQPAAAAKDEPSNGLSSDEARRRLEKFGPNAMPDTSAHPLRMALEKVWAPVPWMLEAAIVLEVVLGKYVEAAIIAGLLVFNAALGPFQESGECCQSKPWEAGFAPLLLRFSGSSHRSSKETQGETRRAGNLTMRLTT